MSSAPPVKADAFDDVFGDDSFFDGETTNTANNSIGDDSDHDDNISIASEDNENQDSDNESTAHSETKEGHVLAYLGKIGNEAPFLYELDGKTAQTLSKGTPIDIKSIMQLRRQNMEPSSQVLFEVFYRDNLSRVNEVDEQIHQRIQSYKAIKKVSDITDQEIAKLFPVYKPFEGFHGIFSDDTLYAMAPKVSSSSSSDECDKSDGECAVQYYPLFTIDHTHAPIGKTLQDSMRRRDHHRSQNVGLFNNPHNTFTVPSYPAPVNTIPLPWTADKWNNTKSGTTDDVSDSSIIDIALGLAGALSACFNCGGTHNARDCTHERNESIIHGNLSLFRQFVQQNKRQDDDKQWGKEEDEEDVPMHVVINAADAVNEGKSAAASVNQRQTSGVSVNRPASTVRTQPQSHTQSQPQSTRTPSRTPARDRGDRERERPDERRDRDRDGYRDPRDNRDSYRDRDGDRDRDGYRRDDQRGYQDNRDRDRDYYERDYTPRDNYGQQYGNPPPPPPTTQQYSYPQQQQHSSVPPPPSQYDNYPQQYQQQYQPQYQHQPNSQGNYYQQNQASYDPNNLSYQHQYNNQGSYPPHPQQQYRY